MLSLALKAFHAKLGTGKTLANYVGLAEKQVPKLGSWALEEIRIGKGC